VTANHMTAEVEAITNPSCLFYLFLVYLTTLLMCQIIQSSTMRLSVNIELKGVEESGCGLH
jgi:hypothetical protein